MDIIVNGETRTVGDQDTVADLLGALGLPEKKVAVERNRAIVPKSAYAATALEAGDAIEIVHFVGGG